MNNKLIPAAFFAVALCSVASAQFGLTWSAQYNGTANGQDRGSVVAVDKQLNTYVAGAAAETGSGIDMVVVKYSPTGSQLWRTPIPAVSTGTDTPYAIAVDDNFDVYVTGESQNGPAGSAGAEQFRTAKLRSDGVVLWNRAYSYNNQESRARDLAINSDGHVFVTGWTQGSTQDMLTIRYDQDGIMVSGWPQVYNNGSVDSGVAIAVGPGNNVYVTGASNCGTNTGDDWVTLRYAGSGGAPIWDEFVTGGLQGLKRDHPTDIVVDSQNRTFVCGVIYWNDGDSDAALVSYDISGNPRYSHAEESALTFGLLQDSGYDGAAALDIEINNVGAAVNVFVVGNAQPVLHSNDYLTLCYSAAQNTAGESWATGGVTVGNPSGCHG